MVKMTEESNTAVSDWWLYIGAFLCCTGFGIIPGAIFIAYWAIKRLENVKLGNSYTENNYSIDIQDFHGGNGGSGNGNNNNQLNQGETLIHFSNHFETPRFYLIYFTVPTKPSIRLFTLN